MEPTLPQLVVITIVTIGGLAFGIRGLRSGAQNTLRKDLRPYDRMFSIGQLGVGIVGLVALIYILWTMN